MNKNGWRIIERLLSLKRKNQSWLAKKLGVTPAAITQIKHGDYLLSESKIQKTLQILEANADDKIEMYATIVNARFFSHSQMAALVVYK